MARTTKYKECAMTLKSFLCRKYGGFKRNEDKRCIGCPASGEVCYMNEILQDMKNKKRSEKWDLISS